MGDAPDDDLTRCREAACRSCGAVFDLGQDRNDARHTWRLWNLRYGPCPACGSRSGWCKPFNSVPRRFGGAVFSGAVALALWGLVFAALACGAILFRHARPKG